MLVLLPPSETKVPDGAGPPLDLDALSFPELGPARNEQLTRLEVLSRDVAETGRALQLSAALALAAAALNARLRSAPTRPALDRYTGVLYGALDAPTMTGVQRARADRRLVITSALFGLLAATDRVPSYRVSAGSRLPGGLAAAFWRARLTGPLTELPGPVVDLRSGAYAAFGPVPGAIAVRVVTGGPGGSRLAVSHDNKATKGRLARLLSVTRAEPANLTALLRLLRREGWSAERTGPASVDLWAVH